MFLSLIATNDRFIVWDIPDNAEELKMAAYYSDPEGGQASVETVAYGAYAPHDEYIQVRSSKRKLAVGEYAVFHVKSNFAMGQFTWVIISKNIIINSGTEYASEIHPVITTFSIVVNSEMAPG